MENGLTKLKKQLSEHNLGNLYIFHGEEYFLREHYVKMIKKELLPDGLDSFNLFESDGKALTINALRDAVYSAPLMCEKKLVIIRDFDIFKAPSEVKEQLEVIFSDCPCCLLFVYSEYKPDGRAKIASVINRHALTVEFPLQENTQLIPWIKRHFSALDKQIDNAVAEHLIFQCGGLMNNLKHEIEKIAAYSKRQNISKEDVDAVIIPVLSAKAFEFTNCVADQKYKKAALILQDLLILREQPIMLIGALGKQIRGLYAARLAYESGKDTQFLMKFLGYRSAYPAKLMLESARKRPLTWCRKAVELCAETDLKLKSQTGDSNTMLELLLAELAVC